MKPIPFVASLLLTGCLTSGSSQPRKLILKDLRDPGPQITAADFDPTGGEILFALRTGAQCSLEIVPVAGGKSRQIRPLSFCPDSVESLRDGSVLVSTAGRSRWFETDGGERSEGVSVVVAASAGNFITESPEGLSWMREGTPTVLPAEVKGRGIRILSSRGELLASVTGSDGQSLVRLSSGGAITRLAGPFARIDSFDAAPNEKEAVLSAWTGASFDVGLISIDGSEVQWVAPDKRNETRVSWAPRGNKISYILSTGAGSVLRTVHVPTAYQLSVDIPLADVASVIWEPKAERVAIVESSLTYSSRIRMMKYGGEEQKVVLASLRESPAELDHLPAAAGTSVVIPPKAVQYGVRYPLVVWQVPRIYRWDDGQAELRERVESGTVFLEGNGSPGETFWVTARSLAWVDPKRIFLVADRGDCRLDVPRGVHLICRGEPLPAGSSGGIAEKKGERYVVRTAEEGDFSRYAATLIAELARR